MFSQFKQPRRPTIKKTLACTPINMLSLPIKRLAKGRNTPSNTSSDSNNASSISAKGNSTSVGGYSADREGTGSPPSHIDFRVRHKRNFTSESAGRAKRNKISAEQHYAAKVAKDDIARAGLAVPVLRAKSRGPRAISLGKVDITKVNLVFSQEVAASPFLIPTTLERSSKEIKHGFATDFGTVYIQMLDSCRNAYCGIHDEVSDSTSSVSDTDSDDAFTSSKSLALNPRIDDSLTTREPVAQLSSINAQADSRPPALSMTMEEALAVSKCSRYVSNLYAFYRCSSFELFLTDSIHSNDKQVDGTLITSLHSGPFQCRFWASDWSSFEQHSWRNFT